MNIYTIDFELYNKNYQNVIDYLNSGVTISDMTEFEKEIAYIEAYLGLEDYNNVWSHLVNIKGLPIVNSLFSAESVIYSALEKCTVNDIITFENVDYIAIVNNLSTSSSVIGNSLKMSKIIKKYNTVPMTLDEAILEFDVFTENEIDECISFEISKPYNFLKTFLTILRSKFDYNALNNVDNTSTQTLITFVESKITVITG